MKKRKRQDIRKQPRKSRIIKDPLTGLPVFTCHKAVRLSSKRVSELLAEEFRYPTT
jgi:hypothetical protein